MWALASSCSFPGLCLSPRVPNEPPAPSDEPSGPSSARSSLSLEPKEHHEVARTLVRNTSFLMFGQLVSIPLSIGINALLGRFLGPEDFGAIYLALTFCTLAFLIGEWGQAGALVDLMARNRGEAGVLLGTARMLRCASGAVAVLVLALLAHFSGRGQRFEITVIGVALTTFMQGLTQPYLNAFQAHERTDVPAINQVLGQVVTAVTVAVVLFSGGGLYTVLLAQFLSACTTFVFAWRASRRLQMGALSISKERSKEILKAGYPHFIIRLTMTLQPNVDAFFMARYASAASIGWHAAAHKLIGTLVTPAGTLCSALYPTLCRLRVSDPNVFKRTTENAIAIVLMLVAPAAVGAAIYPDIGIALFSRERFQEAELNVRILSIFLLLVYVTMVAGTSLVAGGQQRKWSLVQFSCVAVSAAADPLLVPYFQREFGNGGLGVGVSMALGEGVILLGAFWLMRDILLSRPVARMFGAVLVAGVTMAAFGYWSRGWIGPWPSALFATLLYAGVLWQLKVLTAANLAQLRGMLARKRG